MEGSRQARSLQFQYTPDGHEGHGVIATFIGLRIWCFLEPNGCFCEKCFGCQATLVRPPRRGLHPGSHSHGGAAHVSNVAGCPWHWRVVLVSGHKLFSRASLAAAQAEAHACGSWRCQECWVFLCSGTCSFCGTFELPFFCCWPLPQEAVQVGSQGCQLSHPAPSKTRKESKISNVYRISKMIVLHH